MESEINDRVTAGRGVLQDCTEALINWRRDMSPTVREISSQTATAKQLLVQVTALFAVTNVRQTAEPPALEPSAFEDEIRTYEIL